MASCHKCGKGKIRKRKDKKKYCKKCGCISTGLDRSGKPITKELTK